MDWIRSWITGITAAAILISVAYTLVPKNSTGHFVKLAGAAILILAIVAPFQDFKLEDIAPYSIRYSTEFENLTQNLNSENEKIQSLIIEDKMSTYILQRAKEIGVTCTASVRAGKSREGYLYPESVVIVLEPGTPENKRLELSQAIEEECDIPDVKQVFQTRKG